MINQLSKAPGVTTHSELLGVEGCQEILSSSHLEPYYRKIWVQKGHM